MKITRKQLKQIIKEELSQVLREEDRMAREEQWLAAQDIPAHPRSGFKAGHIMIPKGTTFVVHPKGGPNTTDEEYLSISKMIARQGDSPQWGSGQGWLIDPRSMVKHAHPANDAAERAHSGWQRFVASLGENK